MNFTTGMLAVLNLGLIGLLPIVFFRRDGRLNRAWFATAAPFFFCAGILLLGLTGVLQASIVAGAFLDYAMQLLAIVLAVASITLIGLTMGVHRVPLALWHQQNDAPAEIVTWGPYARIRHPFYTSFLLALVGSVMAFPHYLTLAALLYAGIALTLTARGEEHRLLASKFGLQYRKYHRHTGRFLPRFAVNSND